MWGGGGGSKLPLSLFLKLARTVPETLNLVRKYTHIFSLRKFIFYYHGPLIFTQNNSVKGCVRDFLVLF